MAKGIPVTSAVPCWGPVTLVSMNLPPSEFSVRIYVVKGADDPGGGGFVPPESAGRLGAGPLPSGRLASVAASAGLSGQRPCTVCL